jgi:hypothetical protein
MQHEENNTADLQYLIRHCERSEAIQTIERLGCHGPSGLAMTAFTP